MTGGNVCSEKICNAWWVMRGAGCEVEDLSVVIKNYKNEYRNMIMFLFMIGKSN